MFILQVFNKSQFVLLVLIRCQIFIVSPNITPTTLTLALMSTCF